MSDPLHIRQAVPEDAPLLLEFIHALAQYEKLEHEVTATEEALRKHLFGPEPIAHALLAFWHRAPAGFAVYFYQFSTFATAPVLYLEDLFVKPELRGRGIGKKLFTDLLTRAREKGCCRYEWSVLDWNTPSIEFYERIGGKALREWIKFRISL